jgi:zinc transport system ATP-binding protein
MVPADRRQTDHFSHDVERIVVPDSPVLDVRRLTVRFGDTVVLRDLSFAVTAGATLAVIGPNGAGKTVLFRALIGSIPHEGHIIWAPRVSLGYVPQKLDLQRDVPVTATDFLRARAHVSGASPRDVAEALTAVGLTADVGSRRIGALSGGQFQRLLVAFALIGSPTVLLLDEATAGVDEPGQERLNALVHRVQQARGLTVLLISHELSVVSHHATAVLCLGRDGAHFDPAPTPLSVAALQVAYGDDLAVHVHGHPHNRPVGGSE